MFHEAPQNIFEKQEYNPRKLRSVGLKDFVSRKMMGSTQTQTRKKGKGKGKGKGMEKAKDKDSSN